MKTLRKSETQALIFSKLFEDPSKQINTKRMVNKIRDKKKEIKTLFLQTIGQFKQENKPLALIKFEEGYKKYLFGEQGELTKLIPELKQEYQQIRSHKTIISSDKISTGDLTYWNANLFSNNFLNRINNVRKNVLSRSKFFSIDQHEVDLFHSHMPNINQRYRSSRSERNITLLTPNHRTDQSNSNNNINNKIKTSPSMNNCLQSRQSFYKIRLSNSNDSPPPINKNRKKYISYTPRNLMNKIISLDTKQKTIAKRLSNLIIRSRTTSMSNKTNSGNIKDEELKEMEAVYDIKTKPEFQQKKKRLFIEAKKRQLQVTTTQAVMIRLTDMIGVINAETAKNCSENIYQEYEKLLNLHDNDILKDQPKLSMKAKEKEDLNKRLLLKLNYKKMKKMEYNMTQSKNQTLNRIIKFYNGIKN